MKHSLITIVLAIGTAHVWAGEMINKSLDAKAEGKVFIDNQRGNISIKGWDKNQVLVKGELDDDAEDYTFKRKGNNDIVFEVDMPRRGSGNNDKGSQLEIFIPHQSQLEAEGVQVNYDVDNVLGGVELSTINGKLNAKKVRHEINLSSINGAISVTDAIGEIQLSSINGKISLSDSDGTLEATTINGHLKVETAAKSIEVESVNGNIELELEKVWSLEIQSVNGDIQASVKQLLAKGEVSINSVSSPIVLKLPKDISAEFQIINQAGGRINNQLSEDKQSRARFGPGKKLNMVLGNGSGEVNIHSVSAKVNLLRN